MKRQTVMACILGTLCMGWLAAGPAYAEDDKPKAPLRVATDAEAAEALAEFKVDFKARGIPKEDVVSQRNYAMKKIAPVQHPDIIEALAKITKHRNKDLRTLSLIYLGDQKLHPGLAAEPILAAMKKHKRDKGMVMTSLQSLCLLKYLGARKEIAALLKHKEIAVKKLAISAVGALEDMRMLKDILLLLGVDADATSSQAESGKDNAPKTDGNQPQSGSDTGGSKDSGGGDGDGGGESETTDPGYSWDGVDVFVPEGEDPEAAVRAAQEKNRSAAEAAARGSGKSSGGSAPASTPKSSAPAGGAPSGASSPSGGSGLGGNSSRGSGASQRGASELIPTILLTLNQLTGVKFSEPGSIKEWLAANASKVRKKQRQLNEIEKAQKKAAKDASK